MPKCQQFGIDPVDVCWQERLLAGAFDDICSNSEYLHEVRIGKVGGCRVDEGGRCEA
jgi:hypothetical protein